MLFWLLAGSALYLLTCYTSAFFMVAQLGIRNYVGSRDDEVVSSPVHARAERAARNFRENYPVFIALGILALVVPGADQGLAITGAAIFVLARIVYLPLYMGAVRLLRSTVFVVGWVGMIMMALALI